jgi:hypothetical protein
MQVPTSTIAIIVTLAALLSSIFTVTLGKILDLIQKHQEHKYSLQKAFFEKKLKTEEAIVSLTQKAISFLGSTSTILTNIPNIFTTPGPGSFLMSQLQILSSQIPKFMQDVNEYVWVAPL